MTNSTCAQNIQFSQGHCHASWDGETLLLDAGSIKRRWQRTPYGLRSMQLQTTVAGHSCDWIAADNDTHSDFSIPGHGHCLLDIRDLHIGTGTDDLFTSKHLSIVIDYSSPFGSCRQIIWAWHNKGIRIAFELKMDAGSHQEQAAHLEQFQVPENVKHSFCWGYYNDTQNRNTPETPMLRQETIDTKDWSIDWASGCALQQEQQALILVKESHKCVNQRGIDSGAFIKNNQLVQISGWGIPAQEVSQQQTQKSWATWYISAANNPAAIGAAVRTFDRTRYPCTLETDAYVIANTWGSGEIGDPRPDEPGNASRRAAHQDVVLQEIESCGDLGIDVLQIDDGWQSGDDTTYVPDELGWHPHPKCWPEGWKPAVEAAQKHDVTLGLWAPAEEISYDELISNWQSGDFRQYKLDFAEFHQHAELHEVIDRCKRFIKQTDYQCRVNWDVTENAPRIGYYYGRELGAIFLANRKPERPVPTIYEPWLMLRDVWEMAHYLPVKQFQISCQNPQHTNKSTEAHKHDISYGLAISCVGIPLFFHRTSLYTEEQRRSVRNWLRGYQCHKHNLHLADCEPVGEAPSNQSWTGFHYTNTKNKGYIAVFRELHDKRPQHGLKIPALAQSTLWLQNCHTGAQWETKVDSSGFVPLTLEQSAQAALLYYQRA